MDIVHGHWHMKKYLINCLQLWKRRPKECHVECPYIARGKPVIDISSCTIPGIRNRFLCWNRPKTSTEIPEITLNDCSTAFMAFDRTEYKWPGPSVARGPGSGHEATACQHLTNGVGTLAKIRAVSKHHRPLNSKIYIIYLNTCCINIFQRHTNSISLRSYIYVPGVHNYIHMYI